MADKKISALTAASTPLAGTEVLPIVQSSTTVKVAVSDLTAGRTFSALGMTLTSTDAGATAAPLLELYRDSASPAVSDTIGEIEFNGEDSAGNKQAYGLIHASILSPTSTAEQGQIHFETATAGALTEKMIIGTTNLVINEIGAVYNVRIEGDTDANLFYTDATNDRIGIGTNSPLVRLHVVTTGTGTNMGDNTIATFRSTVAGRASSIQLSDGTNSNYVSSLSGALGFGSGSAELIRMTSGGDFLVGTTDASGTAGVGSKVVNTAAGFVFAQVTAATTDGAGTAYNYYSTGAGAYRFYVGAGGTIFATSIVITAISDERLKENIRDIDTGLDAIMALKPRRFDWKEGQGQDKKNAAGFIAQEFEDVFPECVGTSRAGEDGIEYKNINHETLIPTLVKAMQEQNQLIDNLTARITALENK